MYRPLVVALAALAASTSPPAAAAPATPFLLRTIQGDSDGDRFGALVQRLADVNGDGVHDLLVGAPAALVSGERRGAVRVISGLTGQTIRTHLGDAAGDEFGAALEQAVVDLDGDGFVDYAVGAPGSGYVRVFSGKKGKTLYTFHPALPAAARFGAAIRYTFDQLSAPTGQFAIGAPDDDSFGDDAGSVWLVREGTSLAVLPGNSVGERFGSALSFDGEGAGGFPVLLVGAPEAANHGRTYVFDLDTRQIVKTLIGPTTGTPAQFGADVDTFTFCPTQGVASCGTRTVVGAPGSIAGQGSARIFMDDLDAPPQTLVGPAADSGFGATSARVTDGAFRIAIGAPGTAGGTGAVHVYDTSDWTESFRVEGVAAGGAFGAALTGGRFDLIDGDELAVGAPDEGAGTVRIYRMAQATPGPAMIPGDLVAASLAPPSSGDVDTATFEAVKGTKLRLVFQAASDGPSKFKLRARLKDEQGVIRKTWVVKAKAAPITRKTKLKSSGTWTLELEAKGGEGGDIFVFTNKSGTSSELFLSKKHKKVKPLAVDFAAILGATLGFEVDPNGGGSPTSIVLLQPDGTTYPDLASFQSGLQFAEIPTLQTGKHRLVVTPAAAGTTEIFGLVNEPASGGVVEID